MFVQSLHLFWLNLQVIDACNSAARTSHRPSRTYLRKQQECHALLPVSGIPVHMCSIYPSLFCINAYQTLFLPSHWVARKEALFFSPKKDGKGKDAAAEREKEEQLISVRAHSPLSNCFPCNSLKSCASRLNWTKFGKG